MYNYVIEKNIMIKPLFIAIVTGSSFFPGFERTKNEKCGSDHFRTDEH